MKKLMTVCVALALALSTLVLAQDASQQTNNQNQTTQDNTKNQQSVSGKVSHDRKTFTSDKDNKTYKVSNPEALKGYEDQQVMLVIQVDPDNNAIHIVSLEPQTQQSPK
jgi:uncharacterized protein (DUF2141 family)